MGPRPGGPGRRSLFDKRISSRVRARYERGRGHAVHQNSELTKAFLAGEFFSGFSPLLHNCAPYGRPRHGAAPGPSSAAFTSDRSKASGIAVASLYSFFPQYNLEGLGPNNETGLCTADQGTWPGAQPYPDGGPDGSHTCRYNFNGDVPDRDLVEYYLPAWHAAVTRAHVSGVMCSYTATNGTPSCASHWALTELLRDTWGMEVSASPPAICGTEPLPEPRP